MITALPRPDKATVFKDQARIRIPHSTTGGDASSGSMALQPLAAHASIQAFTFRAIHLPLGVGVNVQHLLPLRARLSPEGIDRWPHFPTPRTRKAQDDPIGALGLLRLGELAPTCPGRAMSACGDWPRSLIGSGGSISRPHRPTNILRTRQ
ncbi:hypothetical protein ACVB8X_18135 [Streptomyces sp. NRAIS4]